MTTHYNIHLVKTKTDFKLTYRDGKFQNLKRLRGSFTTDVLKYLYLVFPPEESELEAFMLQMKDRVVYTSEVKKPVSVFTQFNNVWYHFYQKQYKIKPKFDGSEGRALNEIIKYLKSINQDNEDAALANWQLILNKWQMLPDFYQKKTDLKKINSNFNVIITELRDSIQKSTGDNHFQSKQKANDISNKYF